MVIVHVKSPRHTLVPSLWREGSTSRISPRQRRWMSSAIREFFPLEPSNWRPEKGIHVLPHVNLQIFRSFEVLHGFSFIKISLVGGFNPSEKYEFVNGKDDISYMENKSHVWNHQQNIRLISAFDQSEIFRLLWRLRTWIQEAFRVTPWNPSMFKWNPKRMDLDVVVISFLMTLGLKWICFGKASKQRCLSGGIAFLEIAKIGFLMAWCGHPIFLGWNYAPFAGLKKKLVDVGSNCADSKWEIHHGSQW